MTAAISTTSFKLAVPFAAIFSGALALSVLLLPTDALSQQIKSGGTWTDACATAAGTALACLPERREGAASSGIGNMIIVSHGYRRDIFDNDDTRIYDIDTDTWSNGAQANGIERSELAGASHGGLHYAVGGRPGSCAFTTTVGFDTTCRDMQVYDPVTDAWTDLAPMPTGRAGLGAVVVGDTLFALGGRTGSTPNSGTALDCVEAYDIAAGTWGPACGTAGALAPMPVNAGDTFAVAHGGEIFVMGGFDLNFGYLNDVQIYDVAQDTWFVGTDMPASQSNLALGKCGKVILATGGQSGGANLATVEAYSIPDDAWTAVVLDSMPTAKSEHSMTSHGGQVYAIGSGIFGNSQSFFEAVKCSSYFKAPK